MFIALGGDFHRGTRIAHQAVDHSIETGEQLGRKPQRPYSGKLMLPMDPEVHASDSVAEELAGSSLNKWAESVLREAAMK